MTGQAAERSGSHTVKIEVSVRTEMLSFDGWTPEQIIAFLEGCAKVLIAQQQAAPKEGE